jgi:hypothetical protein
MNNLDLNSFNTFADYKKNYKQRVMEHVIQEIERTKKIFEKHNITWYGISGAEWANPVGAIMERLEDELYCDNITIKKIDGEEIEIEVMDEDSDLNKIINKIKQGKIKIKKSK